MHKVYLICYNFEPDYHKMGLFCSLRW